MQRGALIIRILSIGNLQHRKIEQGHLASKSHRQNLDPDLGISQVHALNQFAHRPLSHPLPDHGAKRSHTV